MRTGFGALSLSFGCHGNRSEALVGLGFVGLNGFVCIALCVYMKFENYKTNRVRVSVYIELGLLVLGAGVEKFRVVACKNKC